MRKLICLLCLAGCVPPPGYNATPATTDDGSEAVGHLENVTFDGHKYVFWHANTNGTRAGSLVHSQNCACMNPPLTAESSVE